MLRANTLLKGKTDEHLNVFWQYDGRPGLENNITKAFINTIDSLKANGKRKLFREIFGLILPKDNLSFKYYLQTSPTDEMVKSIPDSNKVLFAFSPTGKAWGLPGIDAGNKEVIKRSIEKSLRENYPAKPDEEIKKMMKKQLEETLEEIDGKGGSIPDAWIIVFCNDEPLYCVAMENKLHDLDPFQLRNHCEKSLHMSESHIKYCKYSDILEAFSYMKGYLVEDFLRYMYFLNYWDINRVAQLEGMDKEHIEYYVKDLCRKILADVSGKEVTWHRGWAYKYDSGNQFNREVALVYNPELHCFKLLLYFGTTQKTAKELYEHLKKGYSLDPDLTYANSFHFQYIGTGKNVSGGKAHKQGTYYEYEGMPIERYINFWKDHTKDIFQMGPKDRRNVLDDMLNADIILKTAYDSIRNFSDGYEKKLNIVPEIGVFYSWPFEEAMELDKRNAFVDSIKSMLKKAYMSLGIKMD